MPSTIYVTCSNCGELISVEWESLREYNYCDKCRTNHNRKHKNPDKLIMNSIGRGYYTISAPRKCLQRGIAKCTECPYSDCIVSFKRIAD